MCRYRQNRKECKFCLRTEDIGDPIKEIDCKLHFCKSSEEHGLNMLRKCNHRNCIKHPLTFPKDIEVERSECAHCIQDAVGNMKENVDGIC